MTRLTTAQKGLLDELKETGGLYIRRYSHPWRTVTALCRKGLVRCDEPDHSTIAKDHWVAIAPDTEEGTA